MIARVGLAVPAVLAVLALGTAGHALAQDGGSGWPQQRPQQGGGGHAAPQAVPHRAVVLRFGGAQSARARAALIGSLTSNGWEVVSDADVQAAQQSAQIARLRGSQDYARLALATNATAVIGGSTGHRRRTWSVTVTVYNGLDGSRLGNATWSAETMSALSAPRQTGFDRLSRYLAQAQPGTAPAAEVEEHPWVPPGPIDEELSEHHEEAPPLEDDDKYDGFSVSLLAGTLHRDMSANVTVLSPRLSGGTELRSYESAYIGNFELGVAGEIYPGALLDRQPFPWLGLYVAYRHSLGLSSEGVAPDGSAIPLGTEEQQFDIGLRGRIVAGKARRGFQFDLGIDYSLFEYKFDTATLAMLDPSGVIPPISYSSLRFMVGGSYPVVPVYLRIGAHFAYRLGLGVGDDARAVFGRDTTVADGMDLGISFRSEAPYIVKGFWFGLDFDFMGYSTRFRGLPECVAHPCGVPSIGPWEQVAVPDRVGDAYVRMTIQVGYAYR